MTGLVGAEGGSGADGARVQPAHFRAGDLHTFRYVGWEWQRRGATVELSLRYALEAGAGPESATFTFVERFGFPVPADPVTADPVTGNSDVDQRRLAAAMQSAAAVSAVEVLFVCAGTSYYKAAAPPVVAGVPERLGDFAAELYLHGLAEFALVNDRDPVRPVFTSVPGAVPGDVPGDVPGAVPGTGPALVAVGGGKDSIVTIETLRAAGWGTPDQPPVLASVGTHSAIEATARTAHLEHVVIERHIDPMLLELNRQGALNGHVPVTAINSAALAVYAVLRGCSGVIMSNEWSASVPVAQHRGMAVNHQWSKSLDCERLLAALLPVPYFSLLRPLHEVEICRRFASLRQYFDVVTSCNQAYTAVGRAAATRWCGNCPKCRFVYLGLAPFLPLADMDHIFEGARLLHDAGATDAYRALLGDGAAPPLECIGTVQESRWAMQCLAGGLPGSPVLGDPAWRDAAVVRAFSDRAAPVNPGYNPLTERGEHALAPDWYALVSGNGVGRC